MSGFTIAQVLVGPIVAPLIAAIVVLLVGRWLGARLSGALTVLAMLVSIGGLALLLTETLAGYSVTITVADPPLGGSHVLALIFHLDGLTEALGLSVAVTGLGLLLAMVVRPRPPRPLAIGLVTLALGGVLGMLLTANLVLMWLGMQIAVLALFAYTRSLGPAGHRASVAFLLTHVVSYLWLLAVVIAGGRAHAYSLVALAPAQVGTGLFWLVLLSILPMLGLYPFHTWLAETVAAPASAGAAAAALLPMGGIYLLLRFVSVSGTYIWPTIYLGGGGPGLRALPLPAIGIGSHLVVVWIAGVTAFMAALQAQAQVGPRRTTGWIVTAMSALGVLGLALSGITVIDPTGATLSSIFGAWGAVLLGSSFGAGALAALGAAWFDPSGVDEFQAARGVGAWSGFVGLWLLGLALLVMLPIGGQFTGVWLVSTRALEAGSLYAFFAILGWGSALLAAVAAARMAGAVLAARQPLRHRQWWPAIPGAIVLLLPALAAGILPDRLVGSVFVGALNGLGFDPTTQSALQRTLVGGLIAIHSTASAAMATGLWPSAVVALLLAGGLVLVGVLWFLTGGPPESAPVFEGGESRATIAADNEESRVSAQREFRPILQGMTLNPFARLLPSMAVATSAAYAPAAFPGDDALVLPEEDAETDDDDEPVDDAMTDDVPESSEE